MLTFYLSSKSIELPAGLDEVNISNNGRFEWIFSSKPKPDQAWVEKPEQTWEEKPAKHEGIKDVVAALSDLVPL